MGGTCVQQQAQPQHTWFKTEGRISMAAERPRAWLCALLACLLVLHHFLEIFNRKIGLRPSLTLA